MSGNKILPIDDYETDRIHSDVYLSKFHNYIIFSQILQLNSDNCIWSSYFWDQLMSECISFILYFLWWFIDPNGEKVVVTFKITWGKINYKMTPQKFSKDILENGMKTKKKEDLKQESEEVKDGIFEKNEFSHDKKVGLQYSD